MNRHDRMLRFLWLVLTVTAVIAIIVILCPSNGSTTTSEDDSTDQTTTSQIRVKDLTSQDESSQSESESSEDLTSDEASQAQEVTGSASGTSVSVTSNQDSSDDDSVTEDLVGDDELPSHKEGEVLIQIPEGTTRDQLDELLDGVTYVDTSEVTDGDLAAGMAVLRITNGTSVSEAASDLERIQGIEAAQPNYIYSVSDSVESQGVSDLAEELSAAGTTNDPYVVSGQQWSLYSVDAFDAWNVVKCNGDVSVAVIDTGCDVSHEDLAANIKGTYSAVDDSTDVSDSVGHGTHVAGIISAVSDNDKGVSGVSYNAGLVIVKASEGTNGVFDSRTLAKAYAWIMSNYSKYNIRVINMSIGEADTQDLANAGDDILNRKIDEAYSDGILTVCAAGNSDSNASTPYTDYPGDHATCLSVMNLTQASGWSATSNLVTLASSSNYNTTNSQTKDVCAPGSEIYSTLASSNSAYGMMSGTSMASPLVAGTAALLFAKDESLTPQQVMEVLEGSAVDLGVSGWDANYGYGEVNAAKAVEGVEASIEGSRAVSTGTTAQYSVASNSSGMAWTWSTSDDSVATVDSKGELSAKSPGIVTLTATSAADSSLLASFTVIVANQTLEGYDTVDVGSTVTYVAEPSSLAWTYASSDSNIASIGSSSGRLTALACGTVTVTATCVADPSIKLTKKITVTPASLSSATVSIPNQTYTGSALVPSPTVTLNGKTLVENVDYSVSYADNVNIGTATVLITGKGNYTGTVKATFSIHAASVSLYRLYNPNNGEHFYTANSSERDWLISLGWSYEGVGWNSPSISSTPVYRLYNPNAGEHHYTISIPERDMLENAGWIFEGIGWYSDDEETVPIYREYNANAFAHNHNYTASLAENNWLISLGWRYEGIAWYGV